MKILNIVLAIWLSAMIYNQASAKPNIDTVACRVISIDEGVIQYLKRRIAPF